MLFHRRPPSPNQLRGFQTSFIQSRNHHRISQLIEDCTYSNLNLQMPLQRLPDVPSDPLSQYKHFCTGQHVISLSCSILLASNAEPVWVPHSSSCCCRSCSSWHGLISKARCGPKNHSFLSLFLCLSASVCLCVCRQALCDTVFRKQNQQRMTDKF